MTNANDVSIWRRLLVTTVTEKWHDEVMCIEHDTYCDDHGGWSRDDWAKLEDDERDLDRESFILALRNADKLGRKNPRYRMTLDYRAARYCLGPVGALYTFSDVWADNGQHGFLRTSERIEREIRARWPDMYAFEALLERNRQGVYGLDSDTLRKLLVPAIELEDDSVSDVSLVARWIFGDNATIEQQAAVYQAALAAHRDPTSPVRVGDVYPVPVPDVTLSLDAETTDPDELPSEGEAIEAAGPLPGIDDEPDEETSGFAAGVMIDEAIGDEREIELVLGREDAAVAMSVVWSRVDAVDLSVYHDDAIVDCAGPYHASRILGDPDPRFPTEDVRVKVWDSGLVELFLRPPTPAVEELPVVDMEDDPAADLQQPSIEEIRAEEAREASTEQMLARVRKAAADLFADVLANTPEDGDRIDVATDQSYEAIAIAQAPRVNPIPAGWPCRGVHVPEVLKAVDMSDQRVADAVYAGFRAAMPEAAPSAEVAKPEPAHAYMAGQEVTVFEDPLTETRPEGRATLVSFVADHGCAEYWVVRFEDDGAEVSRMILKPSPDSWSWIPAAVPVVLRGDDVGVGVMYGEGLEVSAVDVVMPSDDAFGSSELPGPGLTYRLERYVEEARATADHMRREVPFEETSGLCPNGHPLTRAQYDAGVCPACGRRGPLPARIRVELDDAGEFAGVAFTFDGVWIGYNAEADLAIGPFHRASDAGSYALTGSTQWDPRAWALSRDEVPLATRGAYVRLSRSMTTPDECGACGVRWVSGNLCDDCRALRNGDDA